MTHADKHEIEAEELLRHATGMSSDGLRAAIRGMAEAIELRASGGPAWRTLVVPDAWYERLDAGIRFPVRVLHAAGIETCQSCEGGLSHAYPEPTIELPASAHEATGFAALAALSAYGIDVLGVGLWWGVTDGMPTDRVWRITLRRPYHERDDERPMFVCGTSAHP